MVGHTLGLLSPEARIVDVGAGGRRITGDVVAVDAAHIPGVDVVADIHQLPLAEGSFDAVFCTGTLQHVRDPWGAVREFHRALKPGGIVYIDVAFMQGYMQDPADYWRFTREGLRLMCQGFEEIDCGVQIGPTCGLVWVLREWADSCFENRYLANLALIATALATAPLRYVDYFVWRKSKAHRVASAVYFRGRKRMAERGESCPTLSMQ
ncbi:MAG TPA: class I SAM-dependent methyltransferase [Pirellulales bacterium]|nr:class I SAM-dependent methyltransferase [Pirellulales bacterium]